MKYVIQSPIIPEAKDYYFIVSFSLDKVKKQIFSTLAYYKHIEDGTLLVTYADHVILDIIEIILDPTWSNQSTPPKPEGFILTDPTTWGDLSFDDIPKIQNPDKLYATKFIEKVESGTSAEEAIIDYLVYTTKLPSTEGWHKI